MISSSFNSRVISFNNLDLKALLLTQGVIVATWLSTFVAARELEPEGSASSPSASSSSSSLCSRELATTLWGAALAFYGSMASAWPASKSVTSLPSGGYSLSKRLRFFVVMAPFTPLFGMALILNQMFTTLTFRIIFRRIDNAEPGPDTMFNKLRRVINDIFAIFGIKQPRALSKNIRLIATTSVVLGMSDSTMLPSSHFYPEEIQVEDNVFDALTLGHRTGENRRLMELNLAGKLALLQSRILPNYKQLMFLDGSFIIGVQVIGYVPFIVYRAIRHLPVSPIEAIGFAFSMLVIVHSLVHILGVISQHPLVIYLNPTEQQKILETCWSTTRWSTVDDVNCENAAMVGVVMVGSIVVAFTILVEWHVLRISWLDAMGPILFSLSLITQLFSVIILSKYLNPSIWEILLHLWCAIISFGGILVSIVATILNWQSNNFDSRTPSVIHYLPFLG